MPSFLKSFMSLGRSYIHRTDGPNGNRNSGVGSSGRVFERETSHNNQIVSDNNGPWMNQVLNYLNVAGDENDHSSQGSNSGPTVRPPKPVKEVVKEHSDVLKALVLLKFEQHEMNISFRNEIATNAAQIGGLNRKISEFEKELQGLKRKITQRSTEDDHQDHDQQQQPEGGNNDQHGDRGHRSRRLLERNFASRVGTQRNDNNNLAPPASAGRAETVCPHCHGSYINLYAHIRYDCHQAPEQLQGSRVQCEFCEKYYSKRYIKVHSRRFCRVA